MFFISKIRDQEREMKNHKVAAKLLGKAVKRKYPCVTDKIGNCIKKGLS